MGILEDNRKIKGGGEWMWVNASILAIDMAVDAKAASEWLPGGMKLLEPARATVFVADYPELTIDVDLSISVNGSVKDPLHELKLGEVFDARLYRMNFARTRSRAVPIPIFPVSPRFMLRNYALRYL